MDPSKSAASAPPAGWSNEKAPGGPSPLPPPYQDQPHPGHPQPAGYPPQGYGYSQQYGPGGYAQPNYMAGQPNYPAGQPNYPAGQPNYPAGQQNYMAGQQYGPPGVIAVQPTVYVSQAPLAQPVNDYLGYSIFTMLCCCLPLGIAALIYSITAREANHTGNQAAAERSSRTARTLNHVALGIGLVFTILGIIYIVVGVSFT